MNNLKIGIVGSGLIGGNLARLFVKAGYEVAIANSRGPASLQPFVEELGEKLHPVTVQEAVYFGDVVVVSIHWKQLDEFPFFQTEGKIIVDTTNPYKSDGTLYDLGDEISSSKVVEHFPDGKVVKAFNTIWYKHLAENGDTSLPLKQRKVVPLAGDDTQAKQIVSKLIEEIGFGPLDTGTLRDGSKIQGAGGMLYGVDITTGEAEELVSRDSSRPVPTV
jgi:predicted dinucleotide-binding enzyme